MFTRRKQAMAVPEVGAEAPEFNLPSAQGGQLRLSMRTAHGPVVVVFVRGMWSEEDVEYFKALSEKEDEINHARASVVGIGAIEPDEARDFVRASGIKSYLLYDYVRVTTRQWGLLEKDKEHGDYARPAVFIVGSDHKLIHAWTDGYPPVEEILAKVSEITGLPKPAEEAEEKPEKAEEGGEKPKKMSAEERERIKAERRAAREAGKSVKTGQREQKEKSEEDGGEPESQTEPEAGKPEGKEGSERDSEVETESEERDEAQPAEARSEPEESKEKSGEEE
jgi:peroxiredoxin